MYESEIRKIFKDYGYLLNDVAGVVYPKEEEVSGFHRRSVYSCDNIVLWMLCNDTNKKDTVKKNGTTTGFAMATAREILRKYIDSPSLKFIGRGKDKDLNSVRIRVHERKKRSLKMTDKYLSGYIAIKVSLSEVPLSEVHKLLETAMDELEESYIVLHDIDVFVDCRGITNREIVQEYLLENDVSIQSIVNDRRNVGDDCISWMVKGKRRNKIYNKFIQMLQSCDVRKAIGSIIADLIYNSDPKFTAKLLRYKEKGMSRVESTFYSGTLRPIEYYTSKMDSLLEFLDECPVCHTGFEKQWKRLIRRIESSFAVYIVNKEVFAYSHWWNSITEKIQGYSRSKVSEKEVEKLLANYSFNDHPMYYVEGNLMEDGTFKVTKTRTYSRDDGSTAITLVPGANRGLYPSFDGLERDVLSFEDVGIVSYRGITIGWPETKLRKIHKALVDVTWEEGIPTVDEIENPSSGEDEPEEEILKEVNISSTGRFVSSHSLAKDGPKEYTIIKYGRREFYGSQVIHLVAKDGTKIRCTKNLQALVEKEIPRGIPFRIELTRAITVRGYKDVRCTLVTYS
jgi:hypothetical protein